jgi:general secretion pathway protein D
VGDPSQGQNVMKLIRWLTVGMLLSTAGPASGQDTSSVRISGDSVTVRFVDADLRVAIQALARYVDRPVLLSATPSVRVTLETPHPISRSDVLPLLRGMIEAQNLELLRDSAFYRVRQKDAPPPAAPTQPVASQRGAALELTVLHLRHARAADVGATLASLYGAGGVDLAGGSARSGTLSEELRRNVVPPQTSGNASRPTTTAPADGGSAQLEGAITVVPDPFTNTLLIRATPHDAGVLRQAVEALDIRPLQVLIEVIIVEARRDRQLAYGLDATLPSTRVGPGDQTVAATQVGGGLGDFVVHVMKIGHPQLDLLLRAGVSRGDVEILSRPVLLAANNQQARFLVGSQRPFVQVSYSLPTAAATRDQVVQYKDVGTRLIVRPTISADGYVTLDVTQEVSNATSETAFDAPVIATREASTQVLVRDGQTIVLGGLSDHQRDVTSGGVPFLSELPLIGGLFGRHSSHATETELFLFLTPRVLRNDDEVDQATTDYRNRAPKQIRAQPSPQEPRP